MAYWTPTFKVFKSDRQRGCIIFSNRSRSEVFSSKAEALACLEQAKENGDILPAEALVVEQHIYASDLPPTRATIAVAQ